MTKGKEQLNLASTSPRRAQLLQQLQLCFHTLSVSIVEIPGDDELPEQYVQRLALEKARAGWRLPACDQTLPVLGSDTEVELDGRIFGKPSDECDAQQMLQQLSGRTHQVLTAVAVKSGENEKVVLCQSKVSFRSLSIKEINAYCKTGEPMGKAGAYAIQGLAAVFISHLQGSFSGVMGLPLLETAELLRDFAVKIPGLDD